MKKYIILTFISLAISLIMAHIIFYEYNSDKVIALNSEKYYFLQLGVYSNFDNMTSNSKGLGSYIYKVDSDKYYVYTCISKVKNNILKAESYYHDLGYDTYIKEFNISNNLLNDNINNLDISLAEKNNIKEFCNQSIQSYKEG